MCAVRDAWAGERRSAWALPCPRARAFQHHVTTSLINAGGSPHVAAGMLHALAASGSCNSSAASTGLLPCQKKSPGFLPSAARRVSNSIRLWCSSSAWDTAVSNKNREKCLPGSYTAQASTFVLGPVQTRCPCGGSPHFRSAFLPSQATCPALLCLGSEVPGGWAEEQTQTSELRSGGSWAPHVLGHSSRAWAAQSLGCPQGHKAPRQGVVLQVWQCWAHASASVTGPAFACFLHFKIILVYISAGPSASWTLAARWHSENPLGQRFGVSLGAHSAKHQPLRRVVTDAITCLVLLNQDRWDNS